MHLAVLSNHENVVHTLLQHETIDINATDIVDSTPLHLAIRTCNEHIVLDLMNHGARATLRDCKGRTPMDLATKRKYCRGLARLLRHSLIEGGALVEGPDQTAKGNMIGKGTSPVSVEMQIACNNYEITITEIYSNGDNDQHWSLETSIMSLIYGESSLEELLTQFRPRRVKDEEPVCTWIHVPENNVSQTVPFLTLLIYRS